MSTRVNSTKKNDPAANLTHLEAAGMRWCRKMMRDRVLYFSRVDKGGSIIVLDAETVDKDIRANLENPAKYEKLTEDPRPRIRTKVLNMVQSLVESSILSLQDRLYITGKTEKGGWSHDPSFVVRAPYVYPLYKIHKLSVEKIKAKVVPPNRMVTSGVNGPTYRVGVFLDSVLGPVSEKYCTGELVKDTRDFLCRTERLKDDGIFDNNMGINLAAMDVCALYPNMVIGHALVAVEHALNAVTDYSASQIGAILMLLDYNLRNSVVHYRGSWYLSLEGAPTGNPEVPPVANIYVRYHLEEKILVDIRVAPYNQLNHRSRFLDDLWSRWCGTEEEFRTFLQLVNMVGEDFGLKFTGECGKSVTFLDVQTTLEDVGLKTDMHVKPTDSTRYLHRRSYHCIHTFTGIPLSQFIRAALICSDVSDRERCIQRMADKFMSSGYNPEDLVAAQEKAMVLDRTSLLNRRRNIDDSKPDVLTCVINHDPLVRRTLNSFFKENEEEIRTLLGDVKVVISEKRHPNTGSILFQKSGFSEDVLPVRDNQMCAAKGCKTRKTMTLDKTVYVNGTKVKLDFRHDCSKKGIVYLGICKNCNDPLHNGDFYFGQSVNSLMTRNNGHRGSYKLSAYDKSAFSMHTYDKHIECFDKKLDNYEFGVVKHVASCRLSRAEDFYIYSTDADTKGLNRYKVMKN